ncbi:MAG: cysteine desulfurase family protein [Propionibacteriaceae bacterium]|nr:cysteine desulfurase family protein [Propionibacteriaceae bacterium]
MRTYLDHAATSPLRPEVAEVLAEALQLGGNPSSLHRTGQLARRRLEEAREELAAAVGADPSEVVFTSGGSEADTLAVLGAGRARPERSRLLISAVEHPAVAESRGHGAELLPADPEGRVCPREDDPLDEQVTLVSVMHVNNETGTIQPIDRWVEQAHRVGAWFHTDAVQALGHLPVHFHDSGADLMSLSAHKIGGPVGIGALLVRRGLTLAPLGLGGRQEGRIRSGTQPVALAMAFAAAATVATTGLVPQAARLGELRDRLRRLCLDLGGQLNGAADAAAPHIVNVTFPETRSQDLLFLLDQAGIDASAGAACQAGVQGPSRVLLAMGRDEMAASSALRFSLGHDSTAADLVQLAEALPEALQRARAAR